MPLGKEQPQLGGTGKKPKAKMDGSGEGRRDGRRLGAKESTRHRA